MTGDSLNRPELSKRAFNEPTILHTLEQILHPLVRAEERRFLARQRARGEGLVVLDIPLLYETHGEKRCDAVLVVSAPRAVQLQRVFSRPGMSLAKLKGIEQRQMSDAEKRQLADIVIPTGHGKRATWAHYGARLRRSGSGHLIPPHVIPAEPQSGATRDRASAMLFCQEVKVQPM